MQACPAGNNRVDSRRFGPLLAVALAIVAVIWLGAAAAADAQSNQVVINSTGPMTSIYINDDLSCQVQMANDTGPAFFGGTGAPAANGFNVGACGTFMQVNQTSAANNLLFGPSVEAGNAGPGLTDFTPIPPQILTGNGTAASPYTVITTAEACASGGCPTGALLATLVETDTYISGSDQYDTTLMITNNSPGQLSGTLYHTGDCFLMGDTGYGAVGGPSNNAPECTLTSSDSPPNRVVSFIPVSGLASNYFEGAYLASESPSGQSPGFWDYVTPTGTLYPNTIDATNNEDNGMGLSWKYSLAGGGATTTIQYATLVGPNNAPANAAPPMVSGPPVAGQVLSCSQGTWTSAAPITYTYQWMQNGSAITGATSSTYTVQSGDAGQSLSCQVTANTDDGIATATSTAVTVTNLPTVSPQPPTVNKTQGATFTAAVNPGGSNTTVHFEYGLDPKYGLTTASNLYVQRTADQAVASGLSLQVVIAGVTGLVPNALYHVRIVATNSFGTVTGPDQTFKTVALPPPPPPVLGREANFAPTSGIVYIKAPLRAHSASLHANVIRRSAAARTRGKGFIPLTEALQLPVGTQVDARNGKLKVTTATTAGRKGKPTKTQSGEFSEGLFEVLQSAKRKAKGLTVLKLLDTGIFPGAPSYKTECAVAGKASTQVGEKGRIVVFKPRRLSHKVLQTLLAGEHGSYQTQGRYSAATVRGTTYAVTDRCDGTLTHVQRGTVVVTDVRRRKNITLHTGRQYLAKAP